MSLNFSANLSFMFTTETKSLVDRYALAKEAGFRAVECAYPYDYAIADLVEAKTRSGLQQVLINTWPGTTETGGYGIGALPGYEELFREKLELSIQYAKALECPRIRIMAAKQMQHSREDMERIYATNLKYAADRLAEEGIVAMIEPCNNHSMPGYLISHPSIAVRLIQELKHTNIKLQLDIFHLQQIEGNLTRSITRYLPLVEHIQIAQVPDRHEPDSPGEINYRYVFDILEKNNYSKWIGCEYIPTNGTLEGLKWIQDMGLHL
jgi:hydroxypyruvate isomerase